MLKEIEVDEPLEAIPRLKVKMMSDRKWQVMCLQDRLLHPIRYARIGDNVPLSILKISLWLITH